MADWLQEHAGLVVPLLLGAVSIALLMPRLPQPAGFRAAGLAAGAASLVTAGFWIVHPGGWAAATFMFYLFAFGAVAGAALMITSHNPVYAALWFAVATLCVCGLFLLRSAPFLAAATVIVYAGAIIVTFLFVIMLARQQGAAIYDSRAARPLPAIVVGFALLGGMLFTIQEWREAAPRQVSIKGFVVTAPGTGTRYLVPAVSGEANPLSRPVEHAELGTMRGLGRSLFGDYLFAVEIAGTLLLVAAIGAIALVPRRSQGTL